MRLPAEHRDHVERRLRDDLIAWFTTVRSSGMPDTVPVWFVWHDPAFVIYSQPDKPKLLNLAHNDKVSLALDDTGGGDDVVRFEGTARIAPDQRRSDDDPEYVTKYEQHIRRLGYGDPATFADTFSVPVLITPTRFRRWV